MNKFMRLGYIKDLLASLFFIIAMVVVYNVDLNEWRKIIYYMLFLAFLIDGFFSLNPDYHTEYLGRNLPSLVLVISGILFLSFLKS